jgi:hypothetical protein
MIIQVEKTPPNRAVEPVAEQERLVEEACMKSAAAMLVVAGLSSMAQAAETATLTLACSGRIAAKYESPQPDQSATTAIVNFTAYSTSVIVNFTAETIQGFGPSMIDARIKITGVNDVNVAFAGSGRGISGGWLWNIKGSIDRVTGDLEASTWSPDPETGKNIISAEYSLNCRPTQRLF